jgi:hypothetical protein
MGQPIHWPDGAPVVAARRYHFSVFLTSSRSRFDLPLKMAKCPEPPANPLDQADIELGLRTGPGPEPGLQRPVRRSASAGATPTSAAVGIWKQAGVNAARCIAWINCRRATGVIAAWFSQQVDAWQTSLERQQPAAPELAFEVLGPGLVGNLREDTLSPRGRCASKYILQTQRRPEPTGCLELHMHSHLCPPSPLPVPSLGSHSFANPVLPAVSCSEL